jgi:hypothetical protein
MFCGNQGLVHIARYDAHLGRRFERAIQQIAKLRESREKRAQAPSESVRRKPAASADTVVPGLREAAQTPPSANCETNPIAPNQNGINKIAATNPPKPQPARPDTHRNAPQPNSGWRRESLITPGKEAENRQNPLPR